MKRLVYQCEGNKQEFIIPESTMSIVGRAPSVDLIIDGSLISRKHFAIDTDEDGHVLLIELGALNKTSINDKQIFCSETILKHNDVITAGEHVFTFIDSSPPPLPVKLPEMIESKTSINTIEEVVEDLKKLTKQKKEQQNILKKEFFKQLSLSDVSLNFGVLSVVIFLLSPVFGIIAIILGITSLALHHKEKKKAILGIILGISSIFWLFYLK